MENYRKSNQYYEDQYDLDTIKMLKKLEEESKVPLKSEIRQGKGYVIEAQWIPTTPFYIKAQWRASHREEIIQKRISEDEYKDRLVKIHKEPKVNCKSCNARMSLVSHLFKNNDTEVVFVFECPRGHSPRKGLYSDGAEYVVPKSKCKECGGALNTTSEKTEKLLVFTETCLDCGHAFTDEYDLSVLKEEVITPEDRKKYCLDFKNSKTLYEAMVQIADVGQRLMGQIEEKEVQEKYRVDEIEKLKVPALEARLEKLTGEFGYVKFQLATPDLGRNVTVEFSVQDPTDRDDRKSTSVLSKAIEKALINTNWRLVNSGSLSNRLGVITGKFRAYESDEDLLILAKQIYKARNT